MVNGTLYFFFAPHDLGFEQGDALAQFIDRIGVEILFAELGGEVVLATRQVFFGVHPGNVDRGRGDVNKTSGFYRGREATDR